MDGGVGHARLVRLLLGGTVELVALVAGAVLVSSNFRGCANRRVANVSIGYEEAVQSLRES